MLTRTQKEEHVAELRDAFARAKSVIVADYRGLSVRQVDALRGKLREAGDGYEYRVAKNTLLRRATADSGLAELTSSFAGPTAVALAFGDPVRLAKVLVDYAKEHEKFELKAGYMDGRALTPAEIATLATLPSLEELRGRIAGLLQAPAQKLLSVVSAPGAQLARLVEARRAKLAESEGGA
jgi:large subunit ribosomal protein L10